MKRNILLFALMPFIWLLGSAQAAGQDDKALFIPLGPSPVGAWVITLEPDGSEMRPRGVLTFHLDGNVIGSAQGDSVLEPDFVSLSTVGMGTWRRTGPRTFEFTLRFFWYDGSGNPDGGNIVRQEIRLANNGKSFDGRLEFDWLTPDGEPFFSGTGGIRGQRIEVQPLGGQ